MDSLYNDLASVYEIMYSTFINYPEEYSFYRTILDRHAAKSVLEIGCGAGHLASLFLENNFPYRGIDLSDQMLALARKRNPNGIFINGDSRSYQLKSPVDSILMTGRTISYLRENIDIQNSLLKAHQNLKTHGIICFDFIDASRFLLEIEEGTSIIHESTFKSDHFIRESAWKINSANHWCFDWSSDFYKMSGGKRTLIGRDSTTIRTFTLDEITLFLQLGDFEIVEVIDKATYAFPTYVIVATVQN